MNDPIYEYDVGDFSSALGFWGDDSDELGAIDVSSLQELGAPLLQARNPRNLLASAARLRPTLQLQARSPATATFVSRIREASRVVLAKNAEIEAFLARQPNALAGVCASVAAAASPAIVITPGGGNRRWELLYFSASDVTIDNFSCSAFTIGADNLLQGTSTVAGAANNAISLAMFTTRSPGALNPQGWAGKVYTEQNSINLTVTNLNAAAQILSLTVGMKIDPCGERVPGMQRKLASKGGLAALRAF